MNDAPVATYVVAFGAGAGSVRTREQAMAELYRELRDRTASGAHLAARPRHLGDAEAGAPPNDEITAHGPKAEDPLVEAAFEILKVVDREGEVTLDRAASSTSCKLSLDRQEAADASADTAKCFLADDPHAGGNTRTRGMPLPF